MPCTALKADGSPCRFNTAKEANVCAVHAPGAREKLRPSRSTGGKGRLTGDLVKLDSTLSSPSSVTSVLRHTIRKLRRGKTMPDVARAIAQLCAVALKAMAADETDKRLGDVEKKVAALAALTPAQLLQLVERGQANGADGH